MTLFIADLHLCEDKPEITERFIRFLRTDAREANSLYILGDFFNLWVGDDDNSKFNQLIINELRDCIKAKTKIYFMPGNRDLLVGKKFLKSSGCCFLSDPSVIDLYGERTLLSHGDIFCTHDVKYLIYRKIVRNTIIRKLILQLPLSWRKWFGGRIRKISCAYTSSLPEKIRNVSQNAIDKLMCKCRANLLIHGHVHKAYDYHISINSKAARRIVLGDWTERKGSILVAKPTASGLDLQMIEIK